MLSAKRIRLTLLGMFLSLFLPLAASAYTVVLRDGRRIEVAENFVVGSSTLTYEVSAGIQITLQLNAIDIAATERANNEVKGALLRRATRKPAQNVNTSPRPSRSANTVTNQDLETYRKARVANEELYEKRRKELGLPSLEEARQSTLATGDRAQVQLLNLREEDERSAVYWRNRAANLRADLADVSARINMVQARLNELPLNYSFGAFTTVAPLPFVPFGTVHSLRPPQFINARSIGVRPGFGATIGFGTAFPQARPFHPVRRHGFGRRPFSGPVGFGTLIALPFDTYDYSFERSSLITELNQLLTQRAGLQARWRELEDEARRSGAYPGWLR